jgi:thioredoxin reductase (NADPH)
MTNNGTDDAHIELTVYTRTGCHLCDDMLAGLAVMQSSLSLSVDIVDIDAEPRLQRLYGHLVPVLMHQDTEICHFFLDVEALKAYFSKTII